MFSVHPFWNSQSRMICLNRTETLAAHRERLTTYTSTVSAWICDRSHAFTRYIYIVSVQCSQNTPIKWFRNEIKCHNDMVKCDVGTQIFSRYVTFDPSTLTVKVCANFKNASWTERESEKEAPEKGRISLLNVIEWYALCMCGSPTEWFYLCGLLSSFFLSFFGTSFFLSVV